MDELHSPREQLEGLLDLLQNFVLTELAKDAIGYVSSYNYTKFKEETGRYILEIKHLRKALEDCRLKENSR